MDTPNHVLADGPQISYYADSVLADGSHVGISSGRTYSCYYYREMLSLCSIDVKHGGLGTQVEVLWGDPGTRQKRIRALVSRFPCLNEHRNETIDVEAIPRLGGR